MREADLTSMGEVAAELERITRALRWVIERLDLIPDAADGVWLSQGLGKVLRPPPEVDAVFTELLNDGEVAP